MSSTFSERTKFLKSIDFKPEHKLNIFDILTILNFNLFCNDNVCFRIFAWSATLSTSLS